MFGYRYFCENYAFYEYNSLTNAAFRRAKHIGDNAFYGCDNLLSANAPVATSAGTAAFAYCSSLMITNTPEIEIISVNMFGNCSKLMSVFFPIATEVQAVAFQNCKALDWIDFPCVTRIVTQAFSGCSALVSLILRADSVATLEAANAFSKTPIADGTGFVYVPKALVNSYKSATNWSTYATQIRAIEDYPDICGG